MCTVLFVEGRQLTSIKQLREVAQEIVLCAGGPDTAVLQDDCCLCPVDMRQTAERAGYQLLRGPSLRDDIGYTWAKVLH